MARIWLSIFVVFFSLCVVAWGTDFVTLQGETTVYTVDCKDGVWQSKACSGKLAASHRYRFRALRAHEEVLFWTIGASGPSHKYSNCKVQDGRNWWCPASTDAAHTIAREIRRGEVMDDPALPLRPYRAVSKWRWILLRWGLPAGSSAD